MVKNLPKNFTVLLSCENFFKILSKNIKGTLMIFPIFPATEGGGLLVLPFQITLLIELNVITYYETTHSCIDILFQTIYIHRQQQLRLQTSAFWNKDLNFLVRKNWKKFKKLEKNQKRRTSPWASSAHGLRFS